MLLRKLLQKYEILSKALRVATICFALCLLAVWGTPAQGMDLKDEYALKAAYIFNFAKFTRWPDGQLATSNKVNMCVLADNYLANSFATVNGKNIANRTFTVKMIRQIEDITPCDILYITKGYDGVSLQEILTKVENQAVLTIGETPDFTSQGGVINFVDREGAFRFEVNPGQALAQGGISISSRLLRLAIIVGD